METVMSNEAVAVPSPGSGYGFMLTSLSQFQALGWEIRLSWIRFARQDEFSKISPIA
jgi:hypothetical protein